MSRVALLLDTGCNVLALCCKHTSVEAGSFSPDTAQQEC